MDLTLEYIFFLGWLHIGSSYRGHIFDFFTGGDNTKAFGIQSIKPDSQDLMGLEVDESVNEYVEFKNQCMAF